MAEAGGQDELLARLARVEAELSAQRGEVAALRGEMERMRRAEAAGPESTSTEYFLRPRKPEPVALRNEPETLAGQTHPQRLKPQDEAAGYGTAEAVPLTAGMTPMPAEGIPITAPSASVLTSDFGQRALIEPPAFDSPFAAKPASPDAKRSLENRIGSQWFNRVGILALLIGVAWFLKLAYDNGWIHPSPVGKTITGLLVGAAVVLWSERFRRKGYGAFSYSLKAVGTGTLYLTLWAAFHLYGLLPAPVALTMMVGVTIWNGLMAWGQDAELLAVYALVGGFATPPLLGSGGNHEVFLFTYTLAMDVMVLLLVWKKPWQRLLLGSFPGTVTFFIAWYVKWWSPEFAGVTTLFVVLLAAPFVAVALVGMQREDAFEGLLTPLAAASFLSLAMYSVLQDSGHHAWLPWMAVALAAVYLLLMRVRREGLAEAVHLTLAIVFLTLAIPLKAEGRWITVGWLAEGVALLWVAARMMGPEVQARVRAVMRWLGCGALALGVGQSLMLWDWHGRRAFWNAHFATEAFTVAMLALAAWIARGAAAEGDDAASKTSAWGTIARVSTLVAHLIAASGAVYEIGRYWSYFNDAPDAMRRSILSSDCCSAFLMVYGACLLAWVVLKSESRGRMLRRLGLVYLGLGVFWMLVTQMGEDSPAFTAFLNARLLLELVGAASLALASLLAWRARASDDGWLKLAAGFLIQFNVLVLVAGVREIATYFGRNAAADSALAEAAMISGWLMVYAAALLAVGFWKRMAFVRWQGLILIVFTIAKVFLYDMRNLSSVYRVLSFIGLGVLLMGVSFAYQKDWLNLREADPADEAKL